MLDLELLLIVMHLSLSLYIYIYMYIHIHTYTYIYIYISIYTHTIYIYIYMYECLARVVSHWHPSRHWESGFDVQTTKPTTSATQWRRPRSGDWLREDQAAPKVRLRWTCHFCAYRARRGNSQRLAKSIPYVGPSTGTEVARLRKWHVWCLLDGKELRRVRGRATGGARAGVQKMTPRTYSANPLDMKRVELLSCHRRCGKP